MHSSEEYKLIGRNLFEIETMVYIQKLKKSLKKKEYNDFISRLTLWYDDYFNEEILQAHTVGSHPEHGVYGTEDWILWRAWMDAGEKRRLFFYVNRVAKEVMPIEITNDHDYGHPRLLHQERKGRWMLGQIAKEQAEKIKEEKARQLLIEVVRHSSLCSCRAILVPEEAPAAGF